MSVSQLLIDGADMIGGMMQLTNTCNLFGSELKYFDGASYIENWYL